MGSARRSAAYRLRVQAGRGERNRAPAFGSRGPRRAVDRRQRLIRQHV